ncbi:ThiJ/PfpI family protein [Xylariaceae sp. FL0804]|nr:ThiJ/PfpI family protein [Xylariaceae sp. FL0804]
MDHKTAEADSGSGSDSSAPRRQQRPTVRVGVFIPSECQLLDAACVDVLGSMSHEYLSTVSGLIPAAVIDLAPSVEICYIGTVPAGQPVALTSGLRARTTHRFGDAAVAPGTLDVVLVPGPEPFGPLPDADALAWLREHGKEGRGADVLSVCTGILVCGAAGLLEGRRACGPRGLQDMIRKKNFGEKELVGDKLRWVQDGNFWSSGGVTNGNDLVAAYCRASSHFPGPLVDLACHMLDVGDRGQQYGQGQPAFFLSFAFVLLRAWLKSFWRTERPARLTGSSKLSERPL